MIESTSQAIPQAGDGITTTGATHHATSLIITGFTMGVLHVIAGPDHLSALATLAVGSSWKALTLGVRWGLGHSAGLIVVAIIFIALKGELDLRTLGRYCDFLVGLFMVVLGIYGVLDSLAMYHAKRTKKDSKDLPIGENLSTNSPFSSHSIIIRSSSDDEESSLAKSSSNSSSMMSIDMRDANTQRVVSFMIGLLHGVAGPGGILGVLPAVEMRNWKSSMLYLGTFVITSTVAMGAFAAIYGELTKRIGSTAESMELGLRIFSASMSISVGVLWLVLSAMGKLDEFFH